MIIKTALTAAIILGTASFALATEQDANLANRYAGFNGCRRVPVAATRNVALQPGRVKTLDREGASHDGREDHDCAGASTDGGAAPLTARNEPPRTGVPPAPVHTESSRLPRAGCSFLLPAELRDTDSIIRARCADDACRMRHLRDSTCFRFRNNTSAHQFFSCVS